MSEMYCKHCGMSEKRALLLALMGTMSARVYPSPASCPWNENDGEHEFELREPVVDDAASEVTHGKEKA